MLHVFENDHSLIDVNHQGDYIVYKNFKPIEFNNQTYFPQIIQSRIQNVFQYFCLVKDKSLNVIEK